jgi:ABC-type uncharacterized transport system auxiliary subunit
MNKERGMKSMVRALVLLAVAALAGCSTVNRLSFYDFRGSALSTEMLTPPVPQMNVDYDVTLDSRNMILSGLSVLTNLAKANQAVNAEASMREALLRVDVPEIVRQETSQGSARLLGAVESSNSAWSDYRLLLDIREWGIDARGWNTVAALHLRLTASLYSNGDGQLLWSRSVTVDQNATPSMFGLGQIVGDMVTATALAEMTPSALADGFSALAREAARSVVRRLQSDLDSARSW